MIHIATIGRGFIVDRAIEAMKLSGLYHLSACYSRDLEKAREFQARHGFAKAYDHLETMLDDPEIDAIYIASPNVLHYPQAKAALEKGKHVLLEKPFVEDEQKARELFALAEGKGLILLEAITTIHSDNFNRLKQQLDRAGKIKAVSLSWCNQNPGLKDYYQGHVSNLFNPDMLGGALMDLGIYPIHFALGLFGLPKEVRYSCQNGPNGIDLQGILELIYPDFIVTSHLAIDHNEEFGSLLSGEKGVFEIRNGSIGRCNMITFEPIGQSEKEILSKKPLHHMLKEMEDFARLIEDPKSFQKDCQAWKEQSLKAVSVLETARKKSKGSNGSILTR